MAAAKIKTFCSSCGKQNGRVTCEGCSKLFCVNDFNDHRQELGTQLDQIAVDRDLFRQMLTENISKPQNQALMKQIDQWENQSINKIRQAAEEARRILIKHTAELNTKLEEKLEMLTNELKQSRHENDFFEPKLNQWKEELAQMNHDLTKPSNITIRNDSTPLVTKIVVDILDESYGKSSREARVTYAICPYCNLDCDPHESDIHQQKCLRNPKNIEKRQRTQNNPTSNQNTVQLNYVDQSNDNADIPCQYCNKPIKLRDYHNHTQACVAQHYPPTLEQTESIYRADGPVAAQCRYCNRNCMISCLGHHERNCKQNPVNIALEEQRAIYYPPSTMHMPHYH